MTEQEILESIETILYNPSLYIGLPRKRFYAPKRNGEKLSYIFSNETVQLLLALSQKLVDEKEKFFFGERVNPLKQKGISPFIPKNQPATRVRRLIMKHQDFIFMFFVKSRKVDEALDIIEKNVTVSLHKNNLLHALLDILENEQGTFNKIQLDRVLSITRSFKSFIFKAKEYQEAKLRHKKNVQPSVPFLIPTQNQSVQTNWTYEIDIKQISICEHLLKEIESQVFIIRKNRLASILFEGINLEINQDQEQLRDIIKEFSFNPILNETINKINQNLQEAEDKFDFKTCIDLIRTFLHELCVSIALEIEGETGISPTLPIEEGKKMGRAMDYFRDQRINFLSKEEKDLLASLNSFMSHKGVHILESDREYARISRNMVIEKGLFLMKRLEKYIADRKK